MLQHCAEEEYHTLLDLSGNVSYTSWAHQIAENPLVARERENAVKKI